MQELQKSVSIEFDLQDSTTPSTLLTSNWAIESAQHVTQQPDDSNMVLVAALQLAMVAYCL
jgi:hypothetical protein